MHQRPLNSDAKFATLKGHPGMTSPPGSEPAKNLDLPGKLIVVPTFLQPELAKLSEAETLTVEDYEIFQPVGLSFHDPTRKI